MMYKVLLYAFCILSGYTNLLAQGNHPVMLLQSKLETGDVTALWQLAPYLDSTSTIRYQYMDRQLRNPIRDKVFYILEENCNFWEEGSPVTFHMKASTFLNYLNKYKDRIVYDSVLNAWVAVPLKDRKTVVAVRDIVPGSKIIAQATWNKLFAPLITSDTYIMNLWQKHDPELLKQLAVIVFHNQTGFSNRQLLEFINHITQLEFSFQTMRDQQVWYGISDLLGEQYQLRLLEYFYNHYQEFYWDNNKGLFVNPLIQKHKSTPLELLFEQLRSNNEDSAWSAYTHIAQLKPDSIEQACWFYWAAGIQCNKVIPYNYYKVLPVLSKLKDYYGRNGYANTANTSLHNVLQLLMQKELSFKQRRHLEDSLIKNMQFTDVNQLELATCLYYDNQPLSASSGRIINVWYSKHWGQVISNVRHLTCYLKKAALFSTTGSYGIKDLYLGKFLFAGKKALQQLNKVHVTDTTIMWQTKKAKQYCSANVAAYPYKAFDSNPHCIDSVPGIATQLENFMYFDHLPYISDSIYRITTCASYHQIGDLLQALPKISLRYNKEFKYHFLESRWGLSMGQDFNNDSTRNVFIQRYTTLSKGQLYMAYLKDAGINCLDKNGKPDYDKAYEILQYGMSLFFCEQPYSYNQNANEVFAMIKVLEYWQNTRLGFADQFCNESYDYNEDLSVRAIAWKAYLEDKKLITQHHQEPPSLLLLPPAFYKELRQQ